LASRRYRSKNTLNSNISNIDNRLYNLETRPAPRRIAANAIGAAQIQEEAIGEGSIAPGIIDGTLIAGGSVGSAQIQDLIITANKIFDGAVTSVKIAEGAVETAKLAANSVTSAIIAANAVTSEKVIANAITSEKIIADAITNAKIAANAVTGNEILVNSVPGTVVMANTLAGNAVIANTLSGNTIVANTLSGNTVVANTLSGNTVIVNTLSGNTIVANTLSGNTIIANTLQGNTVIANTLSGNTVIANTLSGNTIIANTISGNTIIANTLSGNTVIANSLYGNTVVANTLYGNSIVAGSLTGDRITGTTTIRLADSLSASPTNYIQFGYITPAGQSASTPGIYGYYGGYPGFYLGGWDRPVDGYSDAGISLGVYNYHTSTPESVMNIYYENVFSAGTRQVLWNTGGFSIFADGASATNPSVGDILLDTSYSGYSSVRVSLGQNADVYGNHPALITDGPIRLQMTAVTISTTSDNHGITVGVNASGQPNQYNIAISDRAIQARLTQSASTLTLNPLGGGVSTGGSLTTTSQVYAGSSVYTMGVTSLTSWQSGATDFSAMSSGAIYSANAGTCLLLSRRDGSNGGVALFYRGSTTIAGTININSATTVQYLSGSDYRLKENVVPLSDGIERLMRLKPSYFNFIDEPQDTVDGFLAHEAQEVVPLAVVGEKDAVDENGNPIHQQIDQAKMVPLLTAALQEAVRKIEALETRVTQLGG
jgi:hypothetical protein